MSVQRRRPSATRIRRTLLLLVAAGCVLLPRLGAARLARALIGTLSDQQGGTLAGSLVRISSPSLIGGELTTRTSERGQ